MCPSSPEQGASLRAAFIHCPQLDQYPYPAMFPFDTRRAGKVRQTVCSMGLLSGPRRREVAPTPAVREELLAFHTERYVDVLRDSSAGSHRPEALAMGLGTADCPIFNGMYEYSALACGASLKGAELILSGQADAAFNPSGGLHHAFPERASGFCYLNDVVLACMRLAGGGMRVLYLDIDAHHGDGVQAAFYDRKDVCTISLHESGETLFPGTGFEDETGSGDGRGYSVNVPLPVGTDDAAYLKAFRQVALPLIGAYDPDVFVMELGMDGLAGDPLTHLCLTHNAPMEVIQAVQRFRRPILAVGGGGYNIPNTVRAWVLAWSMLCGQMGQRQDASMAPGGVEPAIADRCGELRDRTPVPQEPVRRRVDAAVDATIEKVRSNVFRFHGL
ncbi:MAG: acetoin utilization protein AcuC [Phycisphaerae bacterium]|nr:acetoin utilization protein AcuC [Phycisphaerae bacterium]